MSIHRHKTLPAFTLIELMVVIFIIGILAAVAIPMMRGRMDSAKWSEGRAAAGTIRTAARAFCAEKGEAYNYAGTTLTDLGFDVTGGGGGELDGKYFTDDCYSIVFNGFNDYIITVDADASLSDEHPTAPIIGTLNSDGEWN